MKRNLVFVSMSFGVAVLTLFSCKKESISTGLEPLKPGSGTTKSAESYGISTDGRMLIFNTLDDYARVVENPDESTMADFTREAQALSFTSYAEQLDNLPEEQRTNELGSDYFTSFVNTDYIVQIGNYVYKLAPKQSKVLVLDAADIAYYDDLKNMNTTNKKIRVFSMADDVVELAESGAEGEKGLFCSENNATPDPFDDMSYSSWEPYTQSVANSNHQYIRRYERRARMNYYNIGIYKNLQAKLEVKGKVIKSPTSTGTYGADWFWTENCIAHIRSKRIYKIRCQAETGWMAVFTSLTNNQLWKCEYNSYQGMKGLHKLWLKGGFYYKTSANGTEISCYDGPLPGETLYHREIKHGY